MGILPPRATHSGGYSQTPPYSSTLQREHRAGIHVIHDTLGRSLQGSIPLMHAFDPHSWLTIPSSKEDPDSVSVGFIAQYDPMHTCGNQAPGRPRSGRRMACCRHWASAAPGHSPAGAVDVGCDGKLGQETGVGPLMHRSCTVPCGGSGRRAQGLNPSCSPTHKTATPYLAWLDHSGTFRQPCDAHGGHPEQHRPP